MIENVCVAGAGTMGAGIALSAALSGFPVILFDTNNDVIDKARTSIKSNLDFLVDKSKIGLPESVQIYNHITFTTTLNDCVADIVIEAIIENLEAKRNLFHSLAAINKNHCILASNTSSLSISKLQSITPNPERVAGMHFFNPAHVMKLVEVVKGDHTSDEVVNELLQLGKRLGKTVVVCKDSPGFIVNRVARPYYLEAMKLVETGVASIEQVDEIMEAIGFKMGPFRLMDLIGMDINLAVSESLYSALDKPARLEPSEIQKEKVKNNELGRKTKKGFYNY